MCQTVAILPSSFSLTAYQCLDHVWPLGAEVLDNVEDINEPLCLDLLNGSAQGTEGTCATNTSTREGEREREREREREEREEIERSK